MSSPLVVDAHTHLWARWPYQPEVPDPRTRGGVANLLLQMDGAGVDHALVVAAGIPGAESNNDDVAAMAVHLMTNTALTGATYDVDGGEQVVGA